MYVVQAPAHLFIAATKLFTVSACVPQRSTSPATVGEATILNVTPAIVTVSLAVRLPPSVAVTL